MTKNTYNGRQVTYDADGNMTFGPLNGVMTTFEYDCRNRLVKAGDTTYEYDAENNNRTAIQTKEKKREEYVINTNTVYSQVLSATTYEKNVFGQFKKETGYTVYTYGAGLISEESRTADSTDKAAGSTGDEGNSAKTTAYGTTYYLYHYNNVGSTTQITDESGNLIYAYAYSPYGERMGTYDGKGNRISDDSTGIRFLYNGQYGVQTDENGLYYMRARYYNTDIKRFLNRDILTGSIENSQSLNWYSYVQGNPVSLTDPFGLCPEGSGISDYLRLIGHTALDMAVKSAKLLKAAKVVQSACRVIGAVAQTVEAAVNFDTAMQSVISEYKETVHISFLNGVNAVAATVGLGMSVGAGIKSIKGFKSVAGSMSSRMVVRLYLLQIMIIYIKVVFIMQEKIR